MIIHYRRPHSYPNLPHYSYAAMQQDLMKNKYDFNSSLQVNFFYQNNPSL
jgi:hypothetical protein